MSKSPDENSIATVGCILSLTAIVIVAIIHGKVDISAWFKPTPPTERYQVVSGRVHNVFTTDEVPAMMKIDTVTGKSWVFFPAEISSGSMHLELPDRWNEVNEPIPSPSPSK